MSDKKVWHPSAKRVVIPTAPVLTFRGGGHKVCWHATQGSSAEGAIDAYRNSGSRPHFTIGIKNGKRVLYQHIPLNQAASALKHPNNTPETNRARCIQVEVVGFAEDAADWD